MRILGFSTILIGVVVGVMGLWGGVIYAQGSGIHHQLNSEQPGVRPFPLPEPPPALQQVMRAPNIKDMQYGLPLRGPVMLVETYGAQVIFVYGEWETDPDTYQLRSRYAFNTDGTLLAEVTYTYNDEGERYQMWERCYSPRIAAFLERVAWLRTLQFDCYTSIDGVLKHTLWALEGDAQELREQHLYLLDPSRKYVEEYTYNVIHRGKLKPLERILYDDKAHVLELQKFEMTRRGRSLQEHSSYHYDENGNRITESHYDPSDGGLDRCIYRDFGKEGTNRAASRLDGSIHDLQKEVVYTLSQALRERSWGQEACTASELAKALKESPENLISTTEYTYQYLWRDDGQGTPLGSRRTGVVTYNTHGQITKRIITTYHDKKPLQLLEAVRYDADSVRTYTEIYRYDSSGRMIEETHQEMKSGGSLGTVIHNTWDYYANGQLREQIQENFMTSPRERYQQRFDEQGNLITEALSKNTIGFLPLGSFPLREEIVRSYNDFGDMISLQTNTPRDSLRYYIYHYKGHTDTTNLNVSNWVTRTESQDSKQFDEVIKEPQTVLVRTICYYPELTQNNTSNLPCAYPEGAIKAEEP